MNPSERNEDVAFVARAVEAAIRIAVIGALVVWSLLIIRPFVMPVLWGIILAVAVNPAYQKLAAKLGGRKKLTAGLLVAVVLALILIPSGRFLAGTVEEVQEFAADWEAGTVQVPPPPAGVEGLPVVGQDLAAVWRRASTNLQAALEPYKDELKEAGSWAIRFGAGLAGDLLMMTIAIILTGVFLATSEAGGAATRNIGRRFAGEQGEKFALLAEKTIRSVAVGVVGIAVIQATLAAIGMAAAGVPAAGLWALAVLILAVIQLPPILVLGPVAAYVFSASDTTVAVLFGIWALLVSFSDAALKPLLLGRGVEVPMLVILLGALGGMILQGITGLFVGAVVLALTYQLGVAWMENPLSSREMTAPPPAEPADE